jgi:hypothetical protein
MAFIQACLIRKNTEELRNKLSEKGLYYGGKDGNSWIFVIDGVFYEIYPSKPARHYKIVDCGTDEELFIELAVKSIKNNIF